MDGTKKIRILVVDDDPDILTFFKMIIRDTRFQLTPVLTGKEALEKAQQEKFELAFIDVKLQEEDGLDVLARWKEIQPDTQIVMISAYSDSLLVREAIQRGAFTYLFKPLKTMDVLSVTVKCLKKLGIREMVSF